MLRNAASATGVGRSRHAALITTQLVAPNHAAIAVPACRRTIHARHEQPQPSPQPSSALPESPFSGTSRGWARRFRLPNSMPSMPSMPSMASLSFPSMAASLPSLPSMAAPLQASLRSLSLRSLRTPPAVSALASLRLRSLRTPEPMSRALAAARSALADEVDMPALTYVDTEFNRATVALTPALRSPFVPTWWMTSAHAQTVFGTLLRFRPPIVYERDVLTLRSDGGTLAMDWDSGRNDKWRIRFEPHTAASPSNPSQRDDPILFLLPGLTGGSRSKYLCQCVEAARRLGWRSVVFNFRGIGVPMTTPRPSTGIDIRDVVEALEHVHACYPRAPILALGYSMGANMLVKSLGTLGPDAARTGLVASAAVSCAFDFVKLSSSLKKPVNNMLYSRFLTYQLKRNYIKQKAVQDLARHVAHLDLAKSLQVSTIWDLDDTFTKFLYGIPCTTEYYKQQSSHTHVQHVASPLFLLNALDDPFEGEIPFEAIRSNPHIVLATTRRGGHVAWARGANPLARDSSWMIATTLQYLGAALTVHRDQNAAAAANEAPAPAAPTAAAQ